MARTKQNLMQKILILLAVFYTLQVNGQNYLITFSGSGASAVVSTVKVENLTKSTTLTLSGSDKLLLTSATDINSFEDNQSAGLKLYPNPMTDNATLEIYPPVEGDVIISICDITGKEVARVKRYLEKHRQGFKLAGIKTGLYLIIVRGNNYQFSEKLISYGNYSGPIIIEEVNNMTRTIDEKNVETESKGNQGIVYMAYNAGERLKFTATSGIYSTVKTDIPASGKTINFNFIACTDGDNNNYPVVEIGTQVWMAENLKTTRWNHGGSLGEVADHNTWLIFNSPAYCWYNNDAASFKEKYGALYNWYAVEGKFTVPFKPWMVWYENLCPIGWHVPADDEWTILTTYLGGVKVAGGKLAETGTVHWVSPNTKATNETGFSALPGGTRTTLYPSLFMGRLGVWWSSTGYLGPWTRELTGGTTRVDRYSRQKLDGYSIRCLKDN
jgi:uncharacterized protein (TIGR02145 family)